MFGYLTTEYPGISSHYGGIGTSIRDLVQGLINRKVVPYVILINDLEDSVQSLDGANIIKIKRKRLPGLTAYLTGIKISRVVNDLVSQGKINVLEVPDWTGLSAFVEVNCPVVMRLNGSEGYFKYLEGKSSKFRYRFLERRAFFNANHIISVSRFTANVTNQVFGSNRSMRIIPNAVDSDCFIPNNTAAEHKTVLYYGTLTRKKGVIELPCIFERVNTTHPDAKFLIIGRDNPDSLTGSSTTWGLMKKQFEVLGIHNVHYIPGVPRHELVAYIQNATVCVFPSYAEALPVTWLEAMSCGKAVVASNIGWASEIIDDHQNGFLVHPANHREFAYKIEQLLSDSELRNRFGLAARNAVVNRFSSKVVLDNYLHFYSKVLGNSFAA